MAFWDFLGGVASGIGDITTSLINRQSTIDTNLQNLGLQQEQWRREDSSVQRRVADLKAAGLNPVLAASGAGAPTSLETKMEAPMLPQGIVNRAISAGLAQQQIARTAADTDIATTAAKVAKDTKFYSEAAVIADAQKRQREAEAALYAAEEAKASAKLREAEANLKAHDYHIIGNTHYLSNISGLPGAALGTGGTLAEMVLNGMRGKFGMPKRDQLGYEKGHLWPK